MANQPMLLARCSLLRILCVAVVFAGASSLTAADQGVAWSTDVEAALQRAAEEQRPVLMEFTASWCVYWKRMEKTAFVDQTVASTVNSRFIPLKIDADQPKALVKDLGIKGLPAMLLVGPDLQIIDRISGFQTPEALMKRLDKIPAPVVVSVTPSAREIPRPTGFQADAASTNPFAAAPAAAPMPAPVIARSTGFEPHAARATTTPTATID